MAKSESFDVVSMINMQEVDNAINQTNNCHQMVALYPEPWRELL